MRKQTDFDVRVYPLGNGAGGESMTHEQVSAHVRDNYLMSGWEVFNVFTNQVSAGVIFLQVSLVKWEDVLEPQVVPSKAK